MMSMVFDNLLHIGLSTNLLEQPFIKVAWSNIRDLANIGFILGIIYIAFSMLADRGNWRKSLIYLIVVIFAINFSLFFARVIVDAGNITANVFLNAVAVDLVGDSSYFYVAETITGETGYKSVGAALVEGLKPENLLGEKNFQAWQGDNETDERKIGGYLAMNVILVIVYFVLGKQFLTAGFMFLGRLVWIVYYMVLAPIFFISLFIPEQESTLKEKWLIPLLAKSFCIVVYLFFIWLIYIILSSGVSDLGGNQTYSDGSVLNSGFWFTLSLFTIKAIFIIILLDKAKSIGSKMCEDGESTLRKIGGGIISSVPFAGKIGRTAMGWVGGAIKGSKLANTLSEKSGVAGWAGDQIKMSGRYIMDKQIGDKSYAEDQNSRMAKLTQFEKEMQSDSLRRRKAARAGVAGVDGELDLNTVDRFVDITAQNDFEKYKFVERYNSGGVTGPLTEEQVKWVAEHDTNIKKLKERGVDGAILQEEFQAGSPSMVSHLFGPQFAASANRRAEDEETKKELEKINKKKAEYEKKIKDSSQEALDRKDIVNKNIVNTIFEVKSNGDNIDSSLNKLSGLKKEEKDNLKEVGKRLKKLNEISAGEEDLNLFNTTATNNDSSTLTDSEKSFVMRYADEALKNGVITSDDHEYMRITAYESKKEKFDKKVIKKIGERHAQSNYDERVQNNLIGVGKQTLEKEIEKTLKNYKTRQNKVVDTDEAFVKSEAKQQINSLDKKIQGVKASQEKPDVRKKTVSEEQRT